MNEVNWFSSKKKSRITGDLQLESQKIKIKINVAAMHVSLDSAEQACRWGGFENGKRPGRGN
jgi:hypothetical protein